MAAIPTMFSNKPATAKDDPSTHTTMRVTKRDGSTEAVDLNKIVRAINRCCPGLSEVDTLRVATKTISGLYDGATTRELDQLSIQTAAALTTEEPQYSKLAARLLSTYIDKEVRNQEIYAFSQSITVGHRLGLVNDRLYLSVGRNARKLNDAIAPERDYEFEYFGLRTVYDRYLLKHPQTRLVIETPQQFFMRIACALTTTMTETIELYRLFSSLEYLPSSPTLFNAGCLHEQLSSCFLVDSPVDDLAAIYKSYSDVALLSKFSGGIGISYSRVRSRGSLIKSTNGASNGIVPWIKTLDSSVKAVNQCFAPETGVFTTKGVKPIRDITTSDAVLGISGAYRQVTAKMTYNQTEPMVEVDVKHSVTPIRVTAGHPFYAITNVPNETSNARTLKQLKAGRAKAHWVDAGQLKEHDYVAQVIPTEVDPVPNFTVEDARMYGILLGDGHHSGSEWGVTGDFTHSHMCFTRAYLEARNIHYWEGERQLRWSFGHGALRDGSTGRMVAATSIPTMVFTPADIYDAPDEKGRKHIARRFAHLARPQTLALLQGLIETDGGISRGAEIYFTNTSQPLIDGVRYQLLRLGVPCAGQYRERDITHEGTRQDGTKIQFNGTVKAFDLRIPAIHELATLLHCKPITKHNWITWQGCVFSRVRSVTPIEPVPFVFDLKVEGDESYMTTAGLAHNGGKRLGACAVYLETWHADVEAFLELRNNTGDEASRTHNLHLANWVPDLFMKRVEQDELWSLFDPKVVPALVDTWGDTFEAAYLTAERAGLAARTVRARDLYMKMLRTLAETGNGWMAFKDASNRGCNQTASTENVVHLSNLCTEIIEVSSEEEVAVCNLGSINLARHVVDGAFNTAKLGDTVSTAIRQLDRVIDLNYYTIPQTKTSNGRWRPVGLGVMGLQDVFFQLGYAFDDDRARALSKRIAEEIYYQALVTSCDLAEEKGPHEAFALTRAARGELQFDAWGVKPSAGFGWQYLRERIQKVGLRNSLMLAIAPTATIASIAGCYECIEPQVSNLFKRETMSGDFIQVNRYLVDKLKALGLWNETTRARLKLAEGSVQNLIEMPADVRRVFRTAWEIPMRSLIDMAADRGAFIDQSQSLNLFIESPNIAQLSSMYFHAWKRGLKTTYYLRSRPATKIGKAAAAEVTSEAALACSLENPESCEACQ